jgi:hypothetical protein
MNENLVLILGALLAVSECLALIPALKANSVLQLAVNVLKKLLPAKKQE